MALPLNYSAAVEQSARGLGIPLEAAYALSLLAFTLFIALYTLIAWRVILLLQDRDIARIDTRVQPGAPFKRARILLRIMLFLLKYLILFPLYSALAFVILALTLLLVAPSQNYELVIALSSAVIAATRLFAYYDERIAHEVIKLIPLTLLAVILLSPQSLLALSPSLELAAIPASLLLASAVFLIALEWALRLMYTLLLLVRTR
ncbi:MAG: hypothetical protein QXH27_04260 [Candidatus Micrarchaeia archaeon]